MTPQLTFLPPATGRSFAVVELIGDLDATLGHMIADTLTSLAERGTTDVFVTTRHVAVSSQDGLSVLDVACNAARRGGCTIALEAGNRRMRTAFASARIATAPRTGAPLPRSARHLIIARHAQPKRLARIA